MPRPGPVLSGSLLVNTKETDHMRKPGKFRLLASMFLALSLMAAACGDDDDTATDTGSDEATDPENDTETESANEGGEGAGELAGMKGHTPRPEERPGGKEWVRKCRTRGGPYH